MRSDSGTNLRLIATVLSQRSFAIAAQAAASELALLFACERVAVGFLHEGCAKLAALSSATEFDARQEEVSRIAAAMDEAIDQAALIAVPREGSAPHIARAHMELARGDGGVCTVPLAHAGEIVGAVTLERAGAPFTEAELACCEDLACLVAPILVEKRAAERTALERARESVRRGIAAVLAPGYSRLKVGVGAGLAALVLLTAVPLPYRISAPARLEGSIQRVVVAPSDGFLRQVNVRPGDAVRENDLLAELAGEDLEVEFRRRESEFLQHENAYQAALARADRALLVVNQAKAAEAKAQLALVENLLDRAQIRAPFDAIVIKGDLAQSLGAPVQRGEVLFTLAPAQGFRLIVEVDERDIARVQSGQTGALALAALPQETLRFVVDRVMPVANAGEGRNYFEVEARLASSHELLRPGLQGVAKLDAGHRSAAWIATHRLVDWMRLSLWTVGL